MAATHQDHHVSEQKPVSFTAPLILAIVTLLILFAFLSLCDPTHGHHDMDHGHGTEHAPMGEAAGPPAH